MLDLAGSLDVDLGDAKARMVARGSTLELEVERARDLRHGGGRALLRSVAPPLASLGLTLRVVSRGRTLLVAGSDARPGLLSKLLLRTPEAELRPWAAIRRPRS